MSDRSLTSLLNRVRWRQLLVGMTAGLSWALVATATTLLAGMWLDLLWELTPRVRILAVVAAAIGGLAIFCWLSRRIWRAARAGYAVRRLDSAGNFAGAVLSGWELSTARGGQRDQHALTAGLARLAVGRATELAATVPLSAAISSRPARRAGGAVAAVATLVALLLLCVPSLARTQWQRFTNPFADVPPFSRVQFHVEPGDAKVLYGDGLDVNVSVSGVPIERMELVMGADPSAEVVPMFPEAGDKWRATLARITESGPYFVRAGRARSRRYQIEVITVPRIDSVRFEVTPPAYTREAVYEGPLPKQGLAGLQGTRVRLWVKSNRPLSGGSIEFNSVNSGGPGEPADDQPAAQADTSRSTDLQPAGASDEVVGEFLIRSSGQFALWVVDADGQRSQQAFAGSITLLDDQRPFVQLLQPRQTSLATPQANLPVEVAAEDDYGVARLRLFRSLNDSRPLPLELAIEAGSPRRVQNTTYLPLSEYGLLEGDEIKLFARVEDNDPAGPKGSESAVATVRIVSQQEFERMLRQRLGLQVLISKYQQAQRRMEKLAAQIDQLQKRLAQQPPDSPAAKELRDQLQKLADDLRDEALAVKESAEHLLPYDLDKNLTDRLERLAEKMAEAAGTAEALAARPTLSSQELATELAKLAQQLRRGGSEFRQRATEPLAELALVYPLLEAESRFVGLVMRQRDLASRMASLRGFDGEDNPQMKVRMRELEDEQRRIRLELADLMDTIETQVERLPDDSRFDRLRDSALDFVSGLRASGASEAMSQGENALVEFRGTAAHDSAQEAARILESFLNQCEGMGGACEECLSFSPGLSQSLGNTIEQLLAEAGLGMGSGPGFGFGQGAGGGYSARRSSASNVGLYGGLPAMGPQGSGRGTAELRQGPGAPSSLTGRSNTDQPALIEAKTTGDAFGGGQGMVPLRYRQRVGQYLQRLAEELNEP